MAEPHLQVSFDGGMHDGLRREREVSPTAIDPATEVVELLLYHEIDRLAPAEDADVAARRAPADCQPTRKDSGSVAAAEGTF